MTRLRILRGVYVRVVHLDVVGPGTEWLVGQHHPETGDTTLRCVACGGEGTFGPNLGVMEAVVCHTRGCPGDVLNAQPVEVTES